MIFANGARFLRAESLFLQVVNGTINYWYQRLELGSVGLSFGH